MHDLDTFLHYRSVDVSSLKELCRRWYPAIYQKRPGKSEQHRALDDIRGVDRGAPLLQGEAVHPRRADRPPPLRRPRRNRRTSAGNGLGEHHAVLAAPPWPGRARCRRPAATTPGRSRRRGTPPRRWRRSAPSRPAASRCSARRCARGCRRRAGARAARRARARRRRTRRRRVARARRTRGVRSRSASAHATITASPVSWPSSSFTALNRSRSSSSSATRSP